MGAPKMILYKEQVIFHMPKCAGTSVIKKIIKDPSNISYMSNHDNQNMLHTSNLSYAKDWEQFMLVRTPYDWYESWYNYVINGPELHRHDAMSAYLMFDNHNPVSLSTYIKRATNLPEFFDTKISKLFISNLARRRDGFLKLFFKDLRNIEFEKTQYQFWYNALASDKTRCYRMEDELSKFLEDTKVGDIGVFNVSTYTSKLTPEDKELIYTADKVIFDKFGYSQ